MCFLKRKPPATTKPKPEYFSKFFTYEEMIYSDLAVRHNILNIPNSLQKLALQKLAIKILDPIRIYYKRPVIVLSGFRSKALNLLVKGYIYSQHTKGEAADIWIQDISAHDLWKWIILKSGLEYDQVILEFNSWVHISFSYKKRRKNSLAKKSGGKIRFHHYTEAQIRKGQYLT